MWLCSNSRDPRPAATLDTYVQPQAKPAAPARSATGTGRFDVDRVVRVLQAIDPDGVALQEVEHDDIDRLDLLEYLATQTGLQPIAEPTLLREERAYGNPLLTRLPVTEVFPLDLSLGGREPRGAIEAILEWGLSLQVVATHLGLLPGEPDRGDLRSANRPSAISMAVLPAAAAATGFKRKRCAMLRKQAGNTAHYAGAATLWRRADHEPRIFPEHQATRPRPEGPT